MGTMDYLYMALLTFERSSRTADDYIGLFEKIGSEFSTGEPSDALRKAVSMAVKTDDISSFDVGTADTAELQRFIGDILARYPGGIVPTAKVAFRYKKAVTELKRRGYPVPVRGYYVDGHDGDPRYLVTEYNE